MKQLRDVQDLPELLLSYAELCYAVSLNLTHDRDKARDLTREVLIWAWHRRHRADFPVNVKLQLLTRLRQRFLQAYRPMDQAVPETAVTGTTESRPLCKAMNGRRDTAHSPMAHVSTRSHAKAAQP